MLLGRVCVSVCVHYNHVHTTLSDQAMLEERLPPFQQRVLAVRKLAKYKHIHTYTVSGRCVEDVIVSVTGQRPVAYRASTREKMRSSLWWSLFARGANSISVVVVYLISLRPFAPLGILVLKFNSLPLMPAP